MKKLTLNFNIDAPVDEVYLALVNPFTIELWSGYKAEMSDTPNSEFSLWDGDITGLNLEFETDKKIVQEWFFDEQGEKSIVNILLESSANGTRTKVELFHENIPDDAYDNIKIGWKEYYFGALKEFFESD